MVNSAAMLMVVLPLTQLLNGAHGMDIGGPAMRHLNSNSWALDRPMSANEIDRELPVVELLKGGQWTFYPNRENPTFEREGRSLESLQPRVGRDEEVQFTETSRSPPFAPRLGRVFHYPSSFRGVPLS